VIRSQIIDLSVVLGYSIRTDGDGTAAGQETQSPSTLSSHTSSEGTLSSSSHDRLPAPSHRPIRLTAHRVLYIWARFFSSCITVICKLHVGPEKVGLLRDLRPCLLTRSNPSALSGASLTQHIPG
jgi:hypothetical protein